MPKPFPELDVELVVSLLEIVRESFWEFWITEPVKILFSPELVEEPAEEPPPPEKETLVAPAEIVISIIFE